MSKKHFVNKRSIYKVIRTNDKDGNSSCFLFKLVRKSLKHKYIIVSRNLSTIGQMIWSTTSIQM